MILWLILRISLQCITSLCLAAVRIFGTKELRAKSGTVWLIWLLKLIVRLLVPVDLQSLLLRPDMLLLDRGSGLLIIENIFNYSIWKPICINLNLASVLFNLNSALKGIQRRSGARETVLVNTIIWIDPIFLAIQIDLIVWIFVTLGAPVEGKLFMVLVILLLFKIHIWLSVVNLNYFGFKFD